MLYKKIINIFTLKNLVFLNNIQVKISMVYVGHKYIHSWYLIIKIYY